MSDGLLGGFGAETGIAQPGQWQFTLAMVTGLALAMLVGLQVALAFAAHLRVGIAGALEARRAWAERALGARRAHRVLGVVLLALVVAHPLFYLSAVTRRLGRFDPERLQHAFTDGSFYADSLLIGLAGALIVVAAAGAAALRRRVPVWHGVVRIGVLLGLWHALRIGSHVRVGPAAWLLWAGMALIALDAAAHGVRAVRRRMGRARLALAASSEQARLDHAGHLETAQPRS